MQFYTKEQQIEYVNKRREERRKYCLEKLGGKCVRCGKTEELEFDHIIPIKSSFNRITVMLTDSLKRLNKELEKCQLLCKECHKIKTFHEDQLHAKNTHGTLSAYRWCGPPKCEECRAIKRKYVNEYRKTHVRIS